MNPLLNHLKPYPFARLREAMQGIDAPEGVTPIHLQIGEPKPVSYTHLTLPTNREV